MPNTADENTSNLDLRASDAEREAVVERLRSHYGEGRISTDELSARLDAVYAARTRADLEPPLVDLPRPAAGRPASVVARRRARAPVIAAAPVVPLLAIAALVVAAAASGAWWLLWLIWPLLHVTGASGRRRSRQDGPPRTPLEGTP